MDKGLKWFDEFWQKYPRKVGKGAARGAWAKAVKIAAPEVILEALKRQIGAGVFGGDPVFVPHPRTWLSQERWEDEVGQEAMNPAMDLARQWRAACRAGDEDGKKVVLQECRRRNLAEALLWEAVKILRQEG